MFICFLYILIDIILKNGDAGDIDVNIKLISILDVICQ